jgi:hypothetical protein
MNSLLAVSVVSAVTFLCGCSTVDPAPSHAARRTDRIEVVPPAQLAAASTSELMARRAQLHEQIAGIQHEVEMKAGLHMGVGIHDDRALLNDLYREARQIDRELLRRFQTGESGPRVNTVKAQF